MTASPFTFDEACDYIRTQCGWTPQQLLEHRDAIAAALRSRMSVAEVAQSFGAQLEAA